MEPTHKPTYKPPYKPPTFPIKPIHKILHTTEPTQQLPTSPIFSTRDDLNKDSDPHLISQLNLNAGPLFTGYPPRFCTRAKLQSYRKLKDQADYKPSQVLRLSRWKCMPLPETYKISSSMKFDYSDTVFQYAPRTGEEIYKQIDWHMNFAHSNLFIAYPGSLLAQDELQVLECPILASVREFLVRDPMAKGFAPYTVMDCEPTPVLVGNADRVINLDTYPDASKGRPHGLYGNYFERANDTAIDLATNILKPSHKVNMIAMEAPPGGYGTYKKTTIEFILKSCYTGFLAAKKESQKVSVLIRGEQGIGEDVSEEEVKTNIYTGFWGCGAYGGDRELMVILQMIGAQMAGVDSLTVHAVHKEGKAAVEVALKKMDEILKDMKEAIGVDELVEKLEKAGFMWGKSNGT